MASQDPTPAPKPALSQEAQRPDEPQESKGLEGPLLADPGRGMEDTAMLKTMLQMRMMMPYMSRLLEPQDHDTGLASLSGELKQSVGDLQLAQRDLRMTVQEQLVQMKRVEEEMHRTREATEKNAFSSTELVEDMKSMQSLVKKSVGIMGTLIAVLVGLVIWMIARSPHLLH